LRLNVLKLIYLYNLITIYTDGASSGNPGPGAYAAILQYNNHRKELVQAFRKTTNNRMELWAVIAGLEALKKEKQQVVIYSDSKYVVDAVEKRWLQTWIKKDFQGKKNSDLWKRFWIIYKKHHVVLKWVKGHAGDPHNERCDQLATKQVRTGPFEIDEVYEKGL
jgi:ribonuclease HI